MSVTVVADLSIKDQELQWVKRMLVQAIEDGPGKIEGFEAAELLENQDDPNNLIIWQQFTTRDHHLAYMNSMADHYPESEIQRYMGSFVRPPIVKYYNKAAG